MPYDTAIVNGVINGSMVSEDIPITPPEKGDPVRYGAADDKTDAQKTQARANIGAVTLAELNAEYNSAKSSGAYKGKDFTYDDFTSAQLAALKGPKGYTGNPGVSVEHSWSGENLVVTDADGIRNLDMVPNHVNGSMPSSLAHGLMAFSGGSAGFGNTSGVRKSAKAMYIGIPSVKLTNLIQPINGMSGWEATAGSMTTSSSIRKYSDVVPGLIGSTSIPESHIATTYNISLIAGHKYYIRAEVYFSGASIRRNTCYWPIAEPSVWNTQSLGLTLNANTWTLLAVISDRGSAGFSSGSYPFRLDFDHSYSTGIMYVDGVMVIDLTAAYGAGNEPSQSWCNNNLSYFTGTITLDGIGTTSYARRVTKIYMGDANNKAQLVYSS